GAGLLDRRQVPWRKEVAEAGAVSQQLANRHGGGLRRQPLHVEADRIAESDLACLDELSHRYGSEHLAGRAQVEAGFRADSRTAGLVQDTMRPGCRPFRLNDRDHTGKVELLRLDGNASGERSPSKWVHRSDP